MRSATQIADLIAIVEVQIGEIETDNYRRKISEKSSYENTLKEFMR